MSSSITMNGLPAMKIQLARFNPAEVVQIVSPHIGNDRKTGFFRHGELPGDMGLASTIG